MSPIVLPIEIVESIADFTVLADTPTLSRLVRTCKFLYNTLNQHLYETIICKTDRQGALCCRSLASVPRNCKLVKSFALLGPDTLSRDNTITIVHLQAFTRDFTTSLLQMSNLEYLNSDVAYCSLQVALTLCEGNFRRLRSLVIRFDHTSLTPCFRTLQRIGKLQEPRLPSLARFIVRARPQPAQPLVWADGVIRSRQHELKDVMVSCNADHCSLRSLRDIPMATPPWSCLETLALSRASFLNCQTALARMPNVKKLTILGDHTCFPAPPPSHVLPILEHIGCSPLNVNAFACENASRPIRSIQLNGATRSGAFDSSSFMEDLRGIQAILGRCCSLHVPIENMKLALRGEDLREFVDMGATTYLTTVKDLVIVVLDTRLRPAVEGIVYVVSSTTCMTVYEAVETLASNLPKLTSICFPNGTVLMHNQVPSAESHAIETQKATLVKCSLLSPILSCVVFGRKYTWKKMQQGWIRVDTIEEYQDHEIRPFDH